MPAAGPPSARAIERVDRLCREDLAERPLRAALLDELRRSVPFDWYAWLLTDPDTEVGSAPLADAPSLADLPRLIRCKYLTEVNRWTRLDAPARSLRAATAGAPERSLVWREVLSAYGVVDVASLVHRDAHGCWSWLDLWRSGATGPFTDDEVAHLAATVPPVTAALRRAQARTFDGAAPLPERTGPVALILAPDLEVRAQTAETEQYLRALVPPDGDRRPVPAGAYNVAAQLLAVEAGVDDHPPSARVHLDSGVWLTLRAARVDTDGPPAAHAQDIAVTIEPTSPAERRSLFARSHALSPRETELLDQLARGGDTRSIAEALYVSEHTVQDHLKSIFAKTGARNRRTLLSRLAGR
jgi:DNA-binding CsgD family transcriptional regulator